MKKTVLFCLCILAISGCETSQRDPQKFYNENIRKSIINRGDGHMLYLYEYGHPSDYNYSFSIEHCIEKCKKCNEIYD